jgi:hypothetical protein
MGIKPFTATAIGSLPYTSAEEAMRLILHSIPGCPIWPQLPKRSFFEKMEIQYSEGLPRIVIDEQKGRIYFNTADQDACAADIGAFYEKYMAAEESGDWSAFAISEKYSSGIVYFKNALSTQPKREWLKVQTTGPVTFSLSIVDENKRAIYYNEMFRDCIVKGMAAKCRWQIDQFKPFTQNIICFVDEPILCAFGSSTYVSVTRDDLVAILREMADAIHASGALCGVHCCGNTEWPILIDAGVDIINFDAFGYGESIALYPQQIQQHLDNGKYIAWGIVPTSDQIMTQTVDSLAALYDKNAARLTAKGIDTALVHRQSLLTPSCGLGSLTPAHAEKVFTLLGGVSKKLQERMTSP